MKSDSEPKAITIQSLQADLTDALKAGKSERVGTLRLVISEIRNFAIKTYGKDWQEQVTPEDAQKVLSKQAKSRKESIDAYTKADRKDLADKEQKELEIISEYLPKELSDDELIELLRPVAESAPNFGAAMGVAMAKVAGRASGDRVSPIIRSLMNPS